jgi:hypothetical protein
MRKARSLTPSSAVHHQIGYPLKAKRGTGELLQVEGLVGDVIVTDATPLEPLEAVDVQIPRLALPVMPTCRRAGHDAGVQ